MLGYRKDMSTSCAAFALLATLPSLSVAGPTPLYTLPRGVVLAITLVVLLVSLRAQKRRGKTTRSRISGCRLRTARTRRAHRRRLPMLRDNPSTGTLRRFSLRRRRTSRGQPVRVPSAIRSSTCRIRSPSSAPQVPPRLTTHSRTVLRAPQRSRGCPPRSLPFRWKARWPQEGRCARRIPGREAVRQEATPRTERLSRKKLRRRDEADQPSLRLPTLSLFEHPTSSSFPL